MTEIVKNQPAMQETWVRSLGQKDPLEKEMTTHSSILAWRIPWTGKELDTIEPWTPSLSEGNTSEASLRGAARKFLYKLLLVSFSVSLSLSLSLPLFSLYLCLCQSISLSPSVSLSLFVSLSVSLSFSSLLSLPVFLFVSVPLYLCLSASLSLSFSSPIPPAPKYALSLSSSRITNWSWTEMPRRLCSSVDRCVAGAVMSCKHTHQLLSLQPGLKVGQFPLKAGPLNWTWFCCPLLSDLR